MQTSPSVQPSALTAYWRLLHPVPSLMTVVIACAFVVLAARGVPALDRFALLLVVELCMQFSISTFNDYFDRHTDRGRADKPVAAGQIAPQTAWTLGAVLAVLAVLLSAPLGVWVLTFTIVGLAGGLLYDAGLKYTAFSWLPFSVAFPTLPLWAWAGASSDGGFPQQLFWVIPVGGVLVLGIHLADTIPDLTLDSEAGVRGLAHRLGLERSLFLCWAAFGVGGLLTIVLASLLAYRLEWYLPGLALGVGFMLGGILAYRAERISLKQMALLLEVGAMVLAVGWVAAITL